MDPNGGGPVACWSSPKGPSPFSKLKGSSGGLPAWPVLSKTGAGEVMQIDVDTHAAPDTTRARYLLLDQIFTPAARPGSTK